LSKRIGEARAAMLGLSMAAAVSVAYAFTTEGWMVFPLTFIGAIQAISYPALNALMSRQVPGNAQGELQGGIASLSSISNIIGPLVMTQTMALFTAAAAPVYFPGAAFILAACINLFAIGLLMTRRREEAKDSSDARTIK
jgi:MFS transporter, DHA1 family, tetracycline resistance protein